MSRRRLMSFIKLLAVVVVVGFTVAAVSVVAGANAVVGENGLIFFSGSRAPSFYAEIYSVAADGAERTNLTRNPTADSGPVVSPDGRRIAFVSQRDGYDAVYVMNADGTGQHRVAGRLFASGYWITSLVWSPTGRRLALTATQPQPGSLFSSSAHYVVDLSSGRLRRLGGIGCAGPRAEFSPDGRFVAYAVAYCHSAREEVKVVRAAGGAERTVASGSFIGWAPRGRRLLYLRRTRKPRIQYVATVDPFGRRPWVLRGVPASAAAWSPAGRLVAFLRFSGRRPGLYVVRSGGRKPRRLLPFAKLSSIAWSPSGAWIAVTAARQRVPEGGVFMYVVRVSGKGLLRVGDARTLPLWSRDSRHLAFVGLDGTARVASPPDATALRVTDPAVDALGGHLDWGVRNRLLFAASGPPSTHSTHLLAVEQDGSGVRQVAPVGAPVGRVSPDGSRVAFVRDSDIWTSGLDGSDLRQLTSGTALDGGPTWSPDGQWIAFARATGPASDIFVVESRGGAVQQLTRLTTRAGGPSWSPDANWIAFLSLGGLFAVRPDGSGLHQISTVGPRVFAETDWSPDGTRLALGGCAIAVVNADGSGYRELTRSGVREGQSSWSPDGMKIVFVRSARPCADDLGFPDDSDLWTINPDGSGETRLTSGPWPDSLPSWQPVRP